MAGGINGICVLHTYEDVKPSKHLGHPDLARFRSDSPELIESINMRKLIIHAQESRSLLWWVSNFTVLFGSLAYTRVKQLAMRSDHRDQSEFFFLFKLSIFCDHYTKVSFFFSFQSKYFLSADRQAKVGFFYGRLRG